VVWKGARRARLPYVRPAQRRLLCCQQHQPLEWLDSRSVTIGPWSFPDWEMGLLVAGRFPRPPTTHFSKITVLCPSHLSPSIGGQQIWGRTLQSQSTESLVVSAFSLLPLNHIPHLSCPTALYPRLPRAAILRFFDSSGLRSYAPDSISGSLVHPLRRLSFGFGLGQDCAA
jgi:hypothetical protein